LDIVPNTQVQTAIWDCENKPKNRAVMKAVDGVNGYMGTDTVRFAQHGYSEGWKLKEDGDFKEDLEKPLTSTTQAPLTCRRLK
jgi:hypothetical protein